jgi:hypothetical protein
VGDRDDRRLAFGAGGEVTHVGVSSSAKAAEVNHQQDDTDDDCAPRQHHQDKTPEKFSKVRHYAPELLNQPGQMRHDPVVQHWVNNGYADQDICGKPKVASRVVPGEPSKTFLVVVRQARPPYSRVIAMIVAWPLVRE